MRFSLARSLAGAKFAASLLLCAAVLRADPSEPSEQDRTRARQLAAEGFAALKRKDYPAAEDLFRKADQLVHAPSLVLDHARALAGLNMLVEAHERYALVIREGVATNAPLPWKRALEVAKAELAQIEPRLAWITIRVPGVRAPEVKIDGKLVPNAALGVRRATNPGTRSIVVRAARFLPAERTIILQEGEGEVVDMSLEPDPDAPPLVAAPKPEIVIVQSEAAPTPPDHTLAYVLLSAGGVGLIAGGVTGALFLRERSSLKGDCPDKTCVAHSNDDYDDYNRRRNRYLTFGTASGVSLAVGAGAALTGAALLIFSGGSASSSTTEKSSSASDGRFQARVGFGQLELSRTF